MEKALLIESNLLDDPESGSESGTGDESDSNKSILAERVTITRPPTPQTSTTGQLFTFCGQTRNVEKKNGTSQSPVPYSLSSMLNTEQDAVVARGEQRRTFSPARVVGSKQPSFSLSSSSLSTSPLGQLWGPHRDSPTPGKRFAGTEHEQDEANFFAEGGADYTSSGFGNGSRVSMYGNGKNLFASNYYNYKPEDSATSDLDNVAANLDLDLAHLDLGPDFDDHDEQRSPISPPYNAPQFPSSVPTPAPQSLSYLSTLTKDVPTIPQTTTTNNNTPGRSNVVRIQKRGTNY